MAVLLSLRRNVAWSVLGNAVYAACQWGMLVVLSKVVSPEQVGVFALALAVTAPIFLFANLQLRAILATDAREEQSFHTYLRVRSACVVLALAAVLGLATFGRYSGASSLVMIGMAAAKSFESLSDVMYGLFQKNERMEKVALSMMIKGTSSLGALYLVVRGTGSVAWGTAALTFVWATVLVFYDVPNARRMLASTARPDDRSPGQRSAATELVLRALPLGLVTMLVSLINNIPRYFIDHFLGAKSLAIFAAMGYVVVAGSTVVSAMGQSASPRLARYYADGDARMFGRTLGRLAAVCAGVGVVGVLIAVVVGRPVLTLLYTPEYSEQPDVFACLMCAGALSYLGSLFGFAVTSMRWFKGQMYIHTLSFPIVLYLNFRMVPEGGLLGAAKALTIYSALGTALYGVAVISLLRKARMGGAQAASGGIEIQ